MNEKPVSLKRDRKEYMSVWEDFMGIKERRNYIVSQEIKEITKIKILVIVL